MNRLTALLLTVSFALFGAACHSEKGGIRNPASPSEPTEVTPIKTVTLSITKVSGNTYQVIVSGPDLPNTFLGLQPNTWDGSLLWLHEWTRNYNYVTDVPFVVGKSDHFTFPYVNNNGTVDFSIRLQPHGTLTRVPVILNDKVKVPAGYKLVWDEQSGEVRVQGSLPS
ncbi:MAG: hypothetical protein ACM3NH_02650 [Candidatus Saccharibacteria bacterium]